LVRLGRTAVSLRGGTKAWAAAGLPIATGAEPGPRRRRGLLAGLRQLARRTRGARR
jgi:hypothetical protein